MEPLETPKTLDEALVASQLGQDQILSSETLEVTASGDKCYEFDLAPLVSVKENVVAGDGSCERMESVNGEGLFVGVGKMVETAKTFDVAFVMGQDQILGSEALEGAASGDKCSESDLASVVSVRDNGATGDVSCECMESVNGESLFVGVGKMLETTKTLDKAFVVGQNQILEEALEGAASGDKCCEMDFASLGSATDNGGECDVGCEHMERVNEEILFVDGGKMLKPSKTVDKDFVIGQDQTLCNEDVEGAASGDKCCELDAAADVSCEHQERVNEEGQFLESGEMLEDIEREIMVGGVRGVDDSEENFLDVDRSETGTLVDGSIAPGIQVTGSGTETVTLVTDEAFAEGNQTEEGSLEQPSEGKSFTVPCSSDMGNEFGLVQGMYSTGNENEEDAVENAVMQEEVKDVDAAELNLVDVGNKVEDSGKGISLYVEVFGPLDGLNQVAKSNCLSGCGLFGSNLSEGTLWTEDDVGGSYSVVPDSRLDNNSGGIDLDRNIIDDPGYSFNAGDFAWAKTKAQSWWPALICEPSDTGEAAVKTKRKTGHLVRYFGNGSLFWCLPSQLKPFHECFEQISRQNNSRGFLSAVEKAVRELGRRVKLEMTCPCFLERIGTDVLGEEGELLMEKECKLGDFSRIQFDPENLLERIKCFATDVSVPGMIEFSVIQSHLSAFYRSIGHQQLPQQQLKPAADAKTNAKDGLTSGVLPSNVASKSRNGEIKKDPKDGNDETVGTMVSSDKKMAWPKITSKSPDNEITGVDNDLGGTVKSEKGYESRERRRSKYLSFPYVNISRGNKSSTNMEEDEMQDPKTVSHVGANKDSVDIQPLGSNPVAKSSGKKMLKRLPKKPTIEHDLNDKLKAISSTEMLSELRLTALDCLYPDESRHFDVVERFFSGFRRLTFCDSTCEIANEDTVRLEFDNQMHLPQTLTEIDVQMEKGMEMGEVTLGVCSTKAAGVSELNKIAESGSTSKRLKGKSKQTEIKKEKTTQLGSNTKPIGDVLQNVTISGPVILDFQKVEPQSSESQSVPKKRKRKVGKTPGIPQIKVMAGLPDLNGSSGFCLEGWNCAGAASPNKGKSESQSKEASLTSLPDVNGSSGNTDTGIVLKDVRVMDLYSTSELNKVVGTQQNVSPHLNAEPVVNHQYVKQIGEPSSGIRDANQIGVLLPSGKPELKKRKRKQKAPDCQTNVTLGIPDLNRNASDSLLQGNQLPEMNCIPSPAKPQRNRRRKKTDVGLLEISLCNGELQTNGEALGTALLLKFSPEHLMPPKENLVSTFIAFGPLKESETRVLNDSATAQIVFASSSDARSAFRSLEKSSPFGPALVNYRLQVILATSGASEPDDSRKMQQAWPADKVKNPRRRRTSKKPKTTEVSPGLKPQRDEGREAPDLQFVKQNLQKMTSMLENAGNNLSPEMRAKLESEIKSLLQKVSRMVGSSSST